MTVKKPLSVLDIMRRKSSQGKGEPIVSLTAYSHYMAKLLDPHCDFLLVGDSLGMVVYGMEDTLAVSVDMMINHGRAVVKARQHACVVVDMPFGSYQESKEQAFRNAAKIISETGADAIKLEGGVVMHDTIRFLVDRGVPVMGHIGLQPQSFHAVGGFKMQGKTEAAIEQLKQDAAAVEAAGAFAVVLECVPQQVGQLLTDAVNIPVIGIGTSACDGQILVTQDMLGLNGDASPAFAKQYEQIGRIIGEATLAYRKEILAHTFPSSK